MKTVIELEPEQIDAIVVQELTWALESFNHLLDSRRTGEEEFGVFVNDVEADCDLIEDHISAVETVLRYYKGSDTLFQEKSMQKVRITYSHPAKEGVELTVVGWVDRVEGDITWVRRIDDYMIDVPTENIISQDVLV